MQFLKPRHSLSLCLARCFLSLLELFHKLLHTISFCPHILHMGLQIYLKREIDDSSCHNRCQKIASDHIAATQCKSPHGLLCNICSNAQFLLCVPFLQSSMQQSVVIQQLHAWHMYMQTQNLTGVSSCYLHIPLFNWEIVVTTCMMADTRVHGEWW